jgi:hypothetical protein
MEATLGRPCSGLSRLEEPAKAIQENIVQLGKQIGFDKLDPEHIQELMGSQGEVTNGELMEVEQERAVEDYSETEESTRVLTAKGMAEVFQHLKKVLFSISMTMTQVWTEAHRWPEVWRMLPTATGSSTMKRKELKSSCLLSLSSAGVWHPSKSDLLLKLSK